MYNYININSEGIISFQAPMNPINYRIGSTIEDYNNGCFILLSEEQLQFFQQYSEASAEEIMQCRISLSRIRALMLEKIIEHDSSIHVNSFFVNNQSMWLDRDTRASLTVTIAAYKAQSIEDITLWTESENPVPVTMPVYTLESLLMNLELYAKQCYDTTANHKRNIQQLTEVQHIIDYDYKAGYPEKLNIQF